MTRDARKDEVLNALRTSSRIALIDRCDNRHSGTIDAIRALAGTVRAANESIVRTNTALGIDAH